MKSDSETKIEVGGLDAVPGDLLEPFDYVALGHLHNQAALNQKNARYSGSPLKFSLSEINQKKRCLDRRFRRGRLFEFSRTDPVI